MVLNFLYGPALLSCWCFGFREPSRGACRPLGWASRRPPGRLTPVSTCQNCCCQCLCSHSEPQRLQLYRRPSRTSKQVWTSLLLGHRSFPWALVHKGLFPPVMWHSCTQTSLAFRARFSGDTSHHLTPSLGSLTQGSELPLLWENLGYNDFPFCGSRTWGVWDLILL